MTVIKLGSGKFILKMVNNSGGWYEFVYDGAAGRADKDMIEATLLVLDLPNTPGNFALAYVLCRALKI